MSEAETPKSIDVEIPQNDFNEKRAVEEFKKLLGDIRKKKHKNLEKLRF